MKKKLERAEKILEQHPRLGLKVEEMQALYNLLADKEGSGSALFYTLDAAYNLGLATGAAYRKRRRRK